MTKQEIERVFLDMGLQVFSFPDHSVSQWKIPGHDYIIRVSTEPVEWEDSWDKYTISIKPSESSVEAVLYHPQEGFKEIQKIIQAKFNEIFETLYSPYQFLFKTIRDHGALMIKNAENMIWYGDPTKI